MGQKTHPTGFRVGIIQKWASSWFAKAKDYREFVAEDAKIRKYIMYLDSDDELTEDTIKLVTDFFDKHFNEVDIVTITIL